MRKELKKGISSLLVFVLVVSLFAGMPQVAYAATTWHWVDITGDWANNSTGITVYEDESSGKTKLYVTDGQAAGNGGIYESDDYGVTWTEIGGDPENWDKPSAIDADDVGNLYVTDYNNNRIMKGTYDSGLGEWSWSLVGPFGGNLTQPDGLVATEEDWLFVTDDVEVPPTNPGKIYEIFKEGTYGASNISTDAALYGPGGVDYGVDAMADDVKVIYIADTENNVIKKSGWDGGYTFTTIPGSNLNKPTDVAVDSVGNLYVSSYGNDGEGTIHKCTFDELGNPTWTDITGDGGSTGQAYGIAVDSDGNVYVTKDGGLFKGSEIPVIDVSHNVAENAKVFQTLPEGYTSGDQETLTVTVTANNGNNNNVLAELGEGDTDCFTLTGGNIGSLAGGGTATFAVEAIDGLEIGVYDATVTITSDEFTAGVSFTVQQIVSPFYSISTVAGTGTWDETYTPYEGLATDGSFSTLAGIAFDSSGTMYFADYDTNVIYMLENGASSIVAGGGETAGPEFTGPATDAELNNPASIVFDSDDNLYILEKGYNVVRKVDATTGEISLVAFISNGDGLDSITGLAVDSQGLLYISDETEGCVYIVNPADNYKEVVAGELGVPVGIAIDGSGNVYIADKGRGVIWKAYFDSDSWDYVPVAGSTHDGPGYSGDGGPATDAKLDCTGVAVDSDGNLYINDYGNNVIRFVDAESEEIYTIAGTGNSGYNGEQDGGPALVADIKLSYNQGIAVDSNGNVYFSDESNGVVRKLAPKQPELPGVHHETVGSDVFLGGNYIEIGISPNGYFGTTEEAPAGFHPPAAREQIGMVADGDGFNIGNAPIAGDIFMPGSPAEGFVAAYKNAVGELTQYKNINDEEDGEPAICDITNITTTDTTNGNTLSATTVGTTTDGKLEVTQVVSFNVNDKYFKVEVTLKNLSADTTFYDARYMRFVDPDIDQDLNDSYDTQNEVVYNPTASSSKSMLISKGEITSAPFIYYSNDSRARVAINPEWSFDPYSEELYQSDGSLLVGTSTGDDGISMTVDFGNIAPGGSFKFVMYESLDPDINSALSALENITGPPVVQHNNGSSTNNDSSTPNTDVVVLVNGKAEYAGTATTGTQGDQTLTTIAIDEKKLEERMASEGNNATITIPVDTKSDIVVGELNGQMIKDMESKQDTLEIRTGNASYFLPAQEIDIAAVSTQLGQSVALKDIKIQVTIAKSTTDTIKVVEDSANKGNFVIQIPPMDFTVKATYGGKTVDVSKFDIYVQRLVAIPDGVDPTKITTGVITEADGTSRHVPTEVVLIDGKYYAKINSLTNSTYTVVWHPIEFTDVTNHWAKAVVNDMGSRMVISGVGSGLFAPDQDITRAEFAAIMVRALGLKPGDGSNSFTDVASDKWYSDYIKTATTYKIIAGYGNGIFGPNDKITREQAMTMIARAMKITGLNANLASGDVEKLLAGFTDGSSASGYAKETIAACVKSGIVSGRGNNQVAPKAYITRAEVAAIVSRLLHKSDLI